MNDMALGLIETQGLTSAVEAADAASKAAQVSLLGYELTKGAGMVTIKFVGHVSAVQAAVSAGVAAANKVGTVISSLVIPRPHEDVSRLINNLETVLTETGEQEQKQKSGVEAVADAMQGPIDQKPTEPQPEDRVIGLPEEEKEEGDVAQGVTSEVDMVQEEAVVKKENKDEEVCNLCGDPVCPRRKGEPHSRCLHYKA